MHRADRGVVSLASQNLTRLPEPRLAGVRAATIGFVFQTFNLIPTLSAQENVEAALVSRQLADAQRRQRALAALDSVGLADEPTGNLDTDTRDEIMSLLQTLWREHGLTLVLVTHDSAIAGRAQRLATMNDGYLCVALAPEDR
jgi:putative ABC transport system ATP-binding protein